MSESRKDGMRDRARGRGAWEVRRFRLGDPEQDLPPSVMHLPMSQHMGLVYQTTLEQLAAHGQPHQPRLQRHVVHIERPGG